ncbi:MAG: type I methionyl aminopeptidase [Dehalococcoidia bacterium]
MGIIVKSPREMEGMRKAGKITASILDVLRSEVRPGITTGMLDEIAVRELARHGAISSFKGYRGFPNSICASVNEQLVHGIPGERKLEEGDIISIDFASVYEGFHGDAAFTVGVGEISADAKRLLSTTEGALKAGISAAREGSHLGDISAAIQEYIESRGFSVVREYVGHGIGREMHEDPQIPNFGTPGHGPILKNGMTMALEPMVNAGVWWTKVLADQWTVVTADGSLSAHFENTIAIAGDKAEILTPL